MQWDIINTPQPPICIFCKRNTNQMARFHDHIGQQVYICSSCDRFVKDAMNKWKELKSVDYIESDICDAFRLVGGTGIDNKVDRSYPDGECEDNNKYKT